MYGASYVIVALIVAALLATFLYRGEHRTGGLGLAVTNQIGAFVVGMTVAFSGRSLIDTVIGLFRGIG